MKEIEILDKFLKFREEQKQVELVIEFSEVGFTIKIFKRKQGISRYAQDQIVFSYLVDKDIDLAFQILKEKIEEVKEEK